MSERSELIPCILYSCSDVYYMCNNLVATVHVGVTHIRSYFMYCMYYVCRSKEESSGIDGLYWCVDYPWPMSDRDVSCYDS